MTRSITSRPLAEREAVRNRSDGVRLRHDFLQHDASTVNMADRFLHFDCLVQRHLDVDSWTPRPNSRLDLDDGFLHVDVVQSHADEVERLVTDTDRRPMQRGRRREVDVLHLNPHRRDGIESRFTILIASSADPTRP